MSLRSSFCFLFLFPSSTFFHLLPSSFFHLLPSPSTFFLLRPSSIFFLRLPPSSFFFLLPSSKNHRGATALSFAAHSGRSDVVEALLAPVERERGERGGGGGGGGVDLGALHASIENGNDSISHIMLRAATRSNKNSQHKNRDGSSNSDDTSNDINDDGGTNPLTSYFNGMTTLIAASRRGRVNLMASLIKLGASPLQRTEGK